MDIIVVFSSFLFVAYLIVNLQNKSLETEENLDFYSIDGLIELTKEEFKKLNDINIDKNSPFYKRVIKFKTDLSISLKKCVYGSIKDKNYIKEVITEILKKHLNQENIDKIIPFSRPFNMETTDLFDILMYVYKKRHSKNAFKEFVHKHNFDKIKRKNINSCEEEGYSITKQEIEKAYMKERIYLTFYDKLEIISQRIYQNYKGFSVIDELRDMNIDGVSGGVNGVNLTINDDEVDLKNIPKSFDSVWVFFEGKSIHLSFLGFRTEEELKRVCQNLYRYNSQGTLSLESGYKVTDMIDGSRVVVVRPDFADSWAFFVRKFSQNHIDANKLFTEEGGNFVRDMLRFIARGSVISAITGAQGSGKTTLLMLIVGYIYPSFTLRVQEMSFELNLRKLYPFKNILSFRETESISGQTGVDLQKKTDGSVLIVGEVASDSVASLMVQNAQVASDFTLFTHHAKTTKDLVLSLRNSLLKSKVFNSEKIAKDQVVSVLDFDIHMKKTHEGKRYIERITEIIKTPKSNTHSDYQKHDTFEQTLLLAQKFFSSQIEEENIETRDIIRFDGSKYVIVGEISKEKQEKMLEVMKTKDREDFNSFCNICKELTNSNFKFTTNIQKSRYINQKEQLQFSETLTIRQKKSAYNSDFQNRELDNPLDELMQAYVNSRNELQQEEVVNV